MTQERYSPQDIEQKWQERWQQQDAFACDHHSDKPKYYVLEMFPYPSGNIHMGHVRNYSIGDVVARCKRMQGFNVLHPMGWDAFGLPAENAAIKHNTHPARWTYANIDNMRAQLRRLGYSYDWSREVATCRPEYYRWEQGFFLRLLEKGLVYRKKAPQNWCPSCHTVLANEQVIDGLCWRCDSHVEQKDLTQWFLRITAYGDELLQDLQKLEGGWPDRVLSMQRNWIGKSTGAAVRFGLPAPLDGVDHLEVFTTRPDTVFGVTFLTLAPEHPLVEKLIEGYEKADDVRAFVTRIRNMDRLERQSDNLEKEGIFTGAYVTHPFTGRQVPVWLGNFVLADYGTGAVMGVPAHDQRDFEFARKYGLPVKVVISPEGQVLDPASMEAAFTAEGVMVNSGDFDGMPNTDGKKAVAERLEKEGKGKATTQFRLRDWNISRQRYWGAPIPVIYCEKCGVVPEKEENLPVLLPLDAHVREDGRSPLPETDSFVRCTCPVCGGIMKHVGTGTQKVEEELHDLFPGTEVLRMDADTAAGRHEQLLDKFEREQIPILLGTQMVAKGLDFPQVTLVGVLAADLSLYVDNYRAAERTFSLLTQVVGRAGRGGSAGRAVIQTYTPENDVIQCAARQDYQGFYEREIRMRRLRRFPPFADLFTFTVSGTEEGAVLRAAVAVREELRRLCALPELAAGEPEVLGPAPAPVMKLNNRYRYRCLLVGKNDRPTREAVSWLLKAFANDRANRGMNLFVDCNSME